MKNHQTVESRKSKVESRLDAASRTMGSRPSTLVPRRAFTLVEVLVVIAVIGVIAALILPLAGVVKRWAFIHTAQAEMSRIETAIDRYHSAYGFYPPGSPMVINNIPISQLYYELVGTTNNMTTGNFVALDGSATIAAAKMQQAFGVSGFMNCNKPGSDESAPHAQDFLPDLKPNQFNQNVTNNNVQVTLLVSAAGGPDPTYRPLGAIDLNPWRYVYPGTNNPGSYDLWVQLQIAGKKYLVCNWSSQVQVNTPSP